MVSKILQQQIGKKHAFDTPEQEAALMILYVADRIESRLGRLFRQHGLTNSQYNVLRILRGEGKRLPALEVASRMIQAVPAITGLIDRLEKQGHVTRHRSEEDRRVVYVEITRQGRQVLSKIDEPLHALHQEALGHMTKKDLKAIIGLLDKAAEQLPRE